MNCLVRIARIVSINNKLLFVVYLKKFTDFLYFPYYISIQRLPMFFADIELG